MFQIPNRLCAPIACALLACLLLLPGGASAEDAKAEAPGGPLVVKIHADWCGTCVKLEPVWQELQAGYGDDARFVVLDVTDRAAAAGAAALADQLGIRAFFDAHKGRTGTVGILDPATGEAVSVFKGETDAEAYRDPLTSLLTPS